MPVEEVTKKSESIFGRVQGAFKSLEEEGAAIQRAKKEEAEAIKKLKRDQAAAAAANDDAAEAFRKRMERGRK